jgi:hypothetical protein
MNMLRKKSGNNPIHNSLKKIQSNNLNYNANYETLMKEIDEDTRR